jgi:hypothetical protein
MSQSAPKNDIETIRHLLAWYNEVHGIVIEVVPIHGIRYDTEQPYLPIINLYDLPVRQG